MAIAAEITFSAEQFQQAINQLKKKWSSLTTGENKTFLAICSTAFVKDVQSHFANESGPSGPWKEWSTAYRQHMDSIGKGGNLILQDSGRLRNSIIPSQVRKTADGVLFYNNAKTSSGFPYAYAHNTGGPKLPQRKFMWLSDPALNDIANQVSRWLANFNDDSE